MALIKMNFLSKHLGMQTNVNVILPSFSFSDIMNNVEDVYVEGMKFQALYLLHGGSGDDSDYVHFTNIIRYADANKLAVIMPADYNMAYTDVEGGARYFSYLVDELPKLCRAFFPISGKREDTFVAGLSMGGGGAMKCGVMRPEQYQSVLCMSGASRSPDKIAEPRKFAAGSMPMPNMAALYGNLSKFKGGPHDVWHHAEELAKQGKTLPDFLFTVGDKDFALESVEDAWQFLSGLGCKTFYEKVPGYGHEWDFWDLTLRKALNEWLPLKRKPV